MKKEEKEKGYSNITTLVIALISSIVGGAVVAYVNHHFTLEAQEQKVWAEQRTKAYIELVEGYSGEAKANRDRNKEAIKRAQLQRLNATFKIAMYGTKEVNEALAGYLPMIYSSKNGGPEWEQQSVALFQAIRNDLLPKEERVSEKTIKGILFPPVPVAVKK